MTKNAKFRRRLNMGEWYEMQKYFYVSKIYSALQGLTFLSIWKFPSEGGAMYPVTAEYK